MVDLSYINYKGCIKAFIILFILAIFFFIFYILIKPDKSQTVNVTPFPTTGPYVPLDSSTCSRNVIQCNDINTCNELCSDSTKENFICTQIPQDKEVWYIGTKLQSGNSYCLPNNQTTNIIQECGTYTGKILWNLDHWECQCKYPSLFNGESCLNQVSCVSQNMENKLRKVTDNGIFIDPPIYWDPKSPIDPSKNPLLGENPFDQYQNGNPKFKCDCDINSYSLNFDPYRCHNDICYAGNTTVTTTAKFDTDTNKCDCSNPLLVQSNVTGYCYPSNPNPSVENNCYPDPITKNCTAGIQFIINSYGVLFRNNNDVYITYKDPSCNMSCSIYKILINNSSAVNKNNVKIVDQIKNLVPSISGSIIEFFMMQQANYSIDIEDSKFRQYIQDSYYQGKDESIYEKGYDEILAFMNSFVSRTPVPNTVPIPCHSYYYTRDNVIACNDQFYASGDMNNKNGNILYNVLQGKICGGSAIGQATLNIFEPEGFQCVCTASNSCPGTTNIDNHQVPTCLQAPRGKGDSCSDDSQCEPCHKCNFDISRFISCCGC